MFRNRSASSHDFAMIPRADIPRSSFRMQKALKASFDAGYLVPILCEEVLPGDTWNLKMTAFARLATPIFPVMDNLHFETFFFFVPNRLVWTNWKKFMGEQTNPGDSISFAIPRIDLLGGGGADTVNSIFDHFGIPVAGQLGPGNTISFSALPFRGYNMIWNEWFRDENLRSSLTLPTGDGPDTAGTYALQRRGKRHDYFTSCLPFTQKGTAVSVPLTGNATVRTSATELIGAGANTAVSWRTAAAGAVAAAGNVVASGAIASPAASVGVGPNTTAAATAMAAGGMFPTNLFADLSSATSTTINALRQSFQIQKLLERDARGGTRYTEIVRSHFGVVSPDARLQRPEYLGGGHQMISINPIAQTSATGLTGATTPQANLAAFGTMLARNHGFIQSFTEHGYIIGLANVRADLTYQQGLRKHWSRQTRYDFYFPAFAMLGEQAVLNREIFCNGDVADGNVFGYQERWAEYRYNPSEIHGLMRSTAAGTIDAWHLSQRFTGLPTLNGTFIDDTPPVSRILAVGAGANGQQLLMDAFYDIILARPLPMYSVPGLIDHF